MRKQWFLIPVFLAFFVLSLSCPKQSPIEPSPTPPSGDNFFFHAEVKGEPVSFHLETGVLKGHFNTTMTQTYIDAYVEDHTNNGWEVSFPGQSTGTFSSNCSVVYNISMGLGTSYINLETNAVVTVTVTKYDPVGGKIEGSFYAHNISYFSNNVFMRYVTFTNGRFSVKRHADESF
jgi:hypothetical protein